MFAASKTASVSGGYQISRSLRFNSADTTFLNRTPATATNRRTWTWSGWVKKDIGARSLFTSYWANTDNGYFNIVFNSDVLAIQTWSIDARVTTQVFRDPSAWYHIVVAVDTTQASNIDRIKIYVNGSQVTTFSSTGTIAQNTDLAVNYNGVHYIGSLTTTAALFNGYMTEVNFIDGQALTPSSFGETNAQTGVWQPKAYSGSYGTNGFYLNFSDNSNTTAATLGKDYSGNGNNWTPNNFSVTAGAGNDSLVDSPTSYGTDTGVGGTVRGNYSTLSPTYAGATGITNGNLDVTLSGGTQYGSMSFTTGKWYWEITATASLSGSYLGVMDSTFIKTDATWGTTTTSVYVNNGDKYGIGGTGAYGASYTTGDVIGFALDLDNGTMVFYKNGASQGTASSGMTGREWRPMLYATGGTYACNFGQRPFAYTAPSGFKALCTQNLPTPTIGATSATTANKYFDISLWTGNGSSQTITNSGGFQPDWVWTKGRSNADSNVVVNAIAGANQFLVTESTQAEATSSALVSAFTSSGFSIGSSTSINRSSSTYVGWQWKANGSGSTNTAGSITSTVSASTTSGFSVVTYTGTGANATVGHGLGVAPSMVIVKRRDTTANWEVRHISIAVANTMRLNLTDAEASATTVWNSTAPSSTLFSIGTSTSVNASSGTYVAYCFAPIAGYSAFGQYTGNGSSDGAFVYTGFRPAYVLIKRTTSAYNWWILDAARGTINAVKGRLYADASDAESTTYPYVDFLSNGFKLRDADGGNNANGEPYIYACFASAPFKYSLAR